MLDKKYSVATGIVFLLIFTDSLAMSLLIAWSPFDNSDKAVFKILTRYLKLFVRHMFHKWRRGMPLRFSTISHNIITATCSIQEDLRKANFVM